MFALILDERWAEGSAAWSHLRACRCFLSSSNLVFTLPVMKRMTVSGGSVLLLSGRSVCSIVLMVARTAHNLVRLIIAATKSTMATEGKRLDISWEQVLAEWSMYQIALVQVVSIPGTW